MWRAFWRAFWEAFERERLKREAERKLRKAMTKYGFTDKDRLPMAGKES